MTMFDKNARLMVIFDPTGEIEPAHPIAMRDRGLRHAILDLPADLDGVDIYDRARKLAELLLEQLQ